MCHFSSPGCVVLGGFGAVTSVGLCLAMLFGECRINSGVGVAGEEDA